MLYKARGLDIERWHDLVAEAQALKKEIGGIARDYGEEWQNGEEDREGGNELHVTPRGHGGGSGMDSSDEKRSEVRTHRMERQ